MNWNWFGWSSAGPQPRYPPRKRTPVDVQNLLARLSHRFYSQTCGGPAHDTGGRSTAPGAVSDRAFGALAAGHILRLAG
jgi:hypothetical protein